MIYKDLAYTIQKGRQRPWGYEISLFIKDNKKEHNIVMRFEREPVEQEINDMAVFWMDKIKTEEEMIEDRIYTEPEVLEFLKSKNLIDDTIKKLVEIPYKSIMKGL